MGGRLGVAQLWQLTAIAGTTKCVMSRKWLVPKVSQVDNSRCMFLMNGSLQGTCVLFMLAKLFGSLNAESVRWEQRNKLALNSPLKPIPTANVFMLLFDLSQLWFVIRCKFYFLFVHEDWYVWFYRGPQETKGHLRSLHNNCDHSLF